MHVTFTFLLCLLGWFFLIPVSLSSVVSLDTLQSWAVAAAAAAAATAGFPEPHTTGLQIHDPSVIKVNNTYYAFGVGPHINISQAESLDGPWTNIGSLLDNLSVIDKGDRYKPWAPNVLEYNGTYYCYYSVSEAGCRDSAIGVATSRSPGPGSWTDHGVVVQSGTGNGSNVSPFNTSNTIDANVLVTNGGAYLSFGSFWTGIWQVRLDSDLISVNSQNVSAKQLCYEPTPIDGGGSNPDPLCRDPTGSHPVEGSFMSYHTPWYYLWFSHGKCCDFNSSALPAAGQEYSIRVGRSVSPQGPYLDRDGKDLKAGGGTIVYGSNGLVYAPGGEGILSGNTDILYYHYLNKSVGYAFTDARMGYNFLKYDSGWPVAVY